MPKKTSRSAAGFFWAGSLAWIDVHASALRVHAFALYVHAFALPSACMVLLCQWRECLCSAHSCLLLCALMLFLCTSASAKACKPFALRVDPLLCTGIHSFRVHGRPRFSMNPPSCREAARIQPIHAETYSRPTSSRPCLMPSSATSFVTCLAAFCTLSIALPIATLLCTSCSISMSFSPSPNA